jgi:hypothetical protein
MRKFLLLLTLVLSVCISGWSQGVTTSRLTGQISDQNGGPLPGANVIAVHEPSGTEYGVSTNDNGNFSIPNMRVGGPYKITISFLGNETLTFGDVYLKLGEPYTLNAKMKEGGVNLNEVIISGVQDRIMNSDRNGAVTSISTRQILNMPTITRSINDMTRMTPQATSTNTGAIGGGNYRQNYITVDGSDFNNTFGIGTNLPASGSPISLDALEEISVNVTPYDIRQSGFIGSSINAVTRSGTNSFSGSAYTFWRNQNQQGNQVGPNSFTKQNLQENTYGFRLGGPIMKNKLFFFINIETGKTTKPGQTNKAATAAEPFGSSPSITRPTDVELDQISTYLQENYNYSTGPYDNYDFVSDNTKFTGRLDWNINKNHRFNVRYSQVESKSPSFPSTSRSPLTAYGAATGRTTNNALWFKNANYYQEANFYSLAAELNSTFFNGKVGNTLRGTFTHQNDPRSSDSKVFPFVDILDGTGGNPGTPFTSFGYEPFTYGNLRDVKTYSIVDNITYTTGIHNITAGLQFDVSATKNGFQRFATSYYTFRNWNDFVTGVKPVDFAITYSLLPNYEQAFPRFKFAQYSIYGQDEMAINDKLKVTVGLRVDLPSYLNVKEIKTHPLVAPLAFENGETIDTGVLPKTSPLWSPRFGFNYDVKGDRSLQLRGGTGVFTGRVPTVWIVSQSGDAGLIQFTQLYQTPAAGRNNPAAFVTPGVFNPDPAAYRPATQPAAGTQVPSSVSAIDRNFKFPQTWKTNLAVDMKLPLGFIGTIEGIYNKDLNIALGRNPNLAPPTEMNIVDASGNTYADHRPIYALNIRDRYLNPLTAANSATPNVPVAQGDVTGTQAFNPVVLDNASKGYYWSVSGKLEKQFENGFSASIAYVLNRSKNVFDGVGDQLLNTWSITQIVKNSNSPELSYAQYVVPSRVIASLTYRKEYLKKLGTQVSLFYEGSIQGRFSYTYSSDFNRDGQTNDLIYIPKDASEITFVDQSYGSGASAVIYTAAQQSALFFKYIDQDKYLSAHKGQYAERNGARLPWRNQLDLRIAQDIFTNIGGKKNTLQFTLDIFNLTNWLNRNWGTFQLTNASALLTPRNGTNITGAAGTHPALDPSGLVKPVFSLASDRNQPVTSTFRDNNTITSTYYMQFGLRYIFN